MNSSLNTDTSALQNTAEKKAEGLAQDFTKNVKQYSSTAVDSISEGYETAIAWVKKNPLQAAAVGVGVGFLVGSVIRRLSDRR